MKILKEALAVKVDTKNNVENYKRVLRGVNITAENPIVENFSTLIVNTKQQMNIDSC